MSATDCKKYVGISFIILFIVFLLNSVIGHIPLEINSPLNVVRDWWFFVTYLIQMATVFFIGFFKECRSSFLAKVGSIIYGILMLISIINLLSYKYSGSYILYFSGVSEYINSLVLYAPGLLLLAWGTNLWLPAKITLSLIVALEVVAGLIWAKLAPMYQNMTDYSFDQTDYLQSIVDVIGYVSSFAVL